MSFRNSVKTLVFVSLIPLLAGIAVIPRADSGAGAPLCAQELQNTAGGFQNFGEAIQLCANFNGTNCTSTGGSCNACTILSVSVLVNPVQNATKKPNGPTSCGFKSTGTCKYDVSLQVYYCDANSGGGTTMYCNNPQSAINQ